jgi:hypothetical protein
MSRFPAIVPPPGFLAFSHQNDRKTPEETADAAAIRRQTVGGLIAAGNDMSITDNVLQNSKSSERWLV